MGISDVIPGVSGGTIAFILGIYERFINAIKGINITFIVPLSKFIIKREKKYLEETKNKLSPMDLGFLVPLFMGIFIAFMIGARIIPYLLDTYPAYTFAFFFGLILGSIKVIFKKIKGISFVNIFLCVVAFVLAFVIAGLSSLQVTHTYTFIFFSGMIAIIAMLLPGISGSFILLLLGQYRFMLEALKEVKIFYILSFLVGAVVGLLSFSRLLSYLLKRHHSNTMWCLIGLMFGALRVPFNNVIFVRSLYPEINFIWDIMSISFVGIFFIFGIIGIMVIETKDKVYLEF